MCEAYESHNQKDTPTLKLPMTQEPEKVTKRLTKIVCNSNWNLEGVFIIWKKWLEIDIIDSSGKFISFSSQLLWLDQKQQAFSMDISAFFSLLLWLGFALLSSATLLPSWVVSFIWKTLSMLLHSSLLEPLYRVSCKTKLY